MPVELAATAAKWVATDIVFNQVRSHWDDIKGFFGGSVDKLKEFGENAVSKITGHAKDAEDVKKAEREAAAEALPDKDEDGIDLSFIEKIPGVGTAVSLIEQIDPDFKEHLSMALEKAKEYLKLGVEAAKEVFSAGKELVSGAVENMKEAGERNAEQLSTASVDRTKGRDFGFSEKIARNASGPQQDGAALSMA